MSTARQALLMLGDSVSRHPVASVFLVAALVRLLSIGLVLLLPDGFIAIDDSTYEQLAGQAARGDTGSWTDYEWQLYRRTATLLIPLTIANFLLPGVGIVPHVIVGFAGAATAAATVALVRTRLETRFAVASGLVVAFAPSQVAWSSVVLKDPLVWAHTSGLALLVFLWIRSRDRRWLLFAGLAGIALFLLGHLRLHTTLVAGWSLFAAVVVARWRHPQSVVFALVIAVVVPWLAGGGPGGLDPLLDLSGEFEVVRLANSEGAESGFIQGWDSMSGIPALEDREVTGDGSYRSRAPEQRGSSRLLADLRYLPRGIGVMLFEPWPWSANRNLRVVLAKLDHVVWYPLLLLAALGLPAVLKERRLLLFPCLLSAGLLFGYAMTEGNVGTAFRHRGELFWATVVLAAFGFERLRQIYAKRGDAT